VSNAIAKRSSSLPVPFQNLIKGLDPIGLAKSGASVGGGFAFAMLGGKLLKEIDAVEQFASKGVLQDIAVDAIGGLILDGIAVAGVYAATKNQSGNDVAVKVAKLMVVGTLLGAVLPNVADRLAEGIDRVVEFVVGIFGKAPKAQPTALPSASAAVRAPALTGRVPRGVESQALQMSIGAPGGSLYALAPGGNLYGLAGMRR
jgi:hypothetical protein